MMKTIVMLFSLAAAQSFAHGQFEFGLGAGNTHPFKGSTAFYENADTGHIETYWLGYALDDKDTVQLEYDHYDFDGVQTEHDALMLAGVRRFFTHNPLHPLAKLGLGAVQSKNLADDKKTSFTAKAAVGLEYDWKWISAGVLASYHYINKAGDGDTFKNAQALSPAIYITFHPAYGAVTAAVEKAKSSVAKVVEGVKDSDKDGVADSDDKCPNTPADTVVNEWGCAKAEKASIKLNIVFPSGKTVVPAKSQGDVDALAAFMKKHPQTTVEIAGHTDNVGAEATNTKLSQSRADAVVAALVKAGVEQKRLKAVGYGPSKPVADNATSEGRAQNRRVIAEVSAE